MLMAIVVLLVVPEETLSSLSSDEESRIAEVTRQIRLLNLVNGLELSRDQMQFIIEKSREAEALRADILRSASGESSEVEHVLKPLSELREVLLRGENIPDTLKAEVHESSLWTKELKHNYDERIAEMAAQVEDILEPHQIHTIETYVPCLIPPKQGAAGQAENPQKAIRLLTKIRELSTSEFERNKRALATRIWKDMEKKLPVKRGFGEEEEIRWLESFLTRTRKLSEVEFALQCRSLVHELKDHYYPNKPTVGIPERIVRFLLDAEMAPLLEQKLALMGG
jgi:hypothetical protein